MNVAVCIEDTSKRFMLRPHRVRTIRDWLAHLGRNPAEELWALRNIDLEIAGGETLGLIGPNGSGKSTLLKCIAGILNPTSGSIRAAGRTASLIELGAGFHPDLTGRENIYLNGQILGLSRKSVDHLIDTIVDFAEIAPFVDHQVKHYSSGMFARLGFAVAVNVEPDILLVDEVLAVGDEAFQKKCMVKIGELQREGRTIIFVSHVMKQVADVCNRVAVLDQGQLVAVGSPTEALAQFRQRLFGTASPLANRPEGIQFDKPPTGNVRFTNVEVQRATVSSGDPLWFRAEFSVKKAVDDLIIGFNLHDDRGVRVFGLNTTMLDLRLSFQPGHGEACFSFQEVPLSAGVYAVTMVARGGDGRLHDQHVQHEIFHVRASEQFVGIVRMNPSVKISHESGSFVWPPT